MEREGADSSLDEVGRRQCVEITCFDPQWLEGLALSAIPSQCIVNLYRNGLVNIFLAFSPGPLLERNLEEKFTPFLSEILNEVQRCT